MNATLTTFAKVDAGEWTAFTPHGEVYISRDDTGGWILETDTDPDFGHAPSLVQAKYLVTAHVAAMDPFTDVVDVPRGPQVHEFETTGRAYDASQCDDRIRTGDVLIVPSESVVGILFDAWPIAVTVEHGDFHTWATGKDWTDQLDYSASYAVALDAAASFPPVEAAPVDVAPVEVEPQDGGLFALAVDPTPAPVLRDTDDGGLFGLTLEVGRDRFAFTF